MNYNIKTKNKEERKQNTKEKEGTNRITGSHINWCPWVQVGSQQAPSWQHTRIFHGFSTLLPEWRNMVFASPVLVLSVPAWQPHKPGVNTVRLTSLRNTLLLEHNALPLVPPVIYPNLATTFPIFPDLSN